MERSGGETVTEHSRNRDGNSPLGWYYSSGLSNVLAKEFCPYLIQMSILALPARGIICTYGHREFVMETDTGHLLSFIPGICYGTRLAKLGQLLLNKGNWNNVQIVAKTSFSGY